MATVQVDTGQHRPRLISSVLIDSYKDAHAEMLSAIAAMDELTRDPTPDGLRLSHTRLRITRASQECRATFKKVVATLSPDGTPAVARAVDELERRHSELKGVTSQHLASWTLSEILSDWPGYCRASADVRHRWRKIIERERQLLSPLVMR